MQAELELRLEQIRFFLELFVVSITHVLIVVLVTITRFDPNKSRTIVGNLPDLNCTC